MNDIGQRLRRLPADTRASLAFFSRLPVGSAPVELQRSAGAWPVAGLLLALIPAALLLLLRAADFPALAAGVLALAVLTGLTGGLHEDGLADTADGFGGGRNREAKLAIMRDSRIGTYGVLALLFALLLKAGSLAALGVHARQAAIALIGAAVVSRSMALWHWNSTLPARPDGLARAAGRPDWIALVFGLSFGLIATLVLVVAFRGAALVAVLLAAAATRLFSNLCRNQIGGHTGDTIGGAQQISETLLLAGLSSAAPAILD